MGEALPKILLTFAHNQLLLGNRTARLNAEQSEHAFFVRLRQAQNSIPSLACNVFHCVFFKTEKLSENAQASLRTIRWIMAILIQASLVRGLIS